MLKIFNYAELKEEKQKEVLQARKKERERENKENGERKLTNENKVCYL